MNVIITALFPSSSDTFSSKETKAIYNLVKDEKNLLVIYPVILPSSFKSLMKHLKEPIVNFNSVKLIKIPILKIPKKEIYLILHLKLLLLLINSLKNINQVVFHRVNIVLQIERFLHRTDISYNYVVHASDIHLLSKNKGKIRKNTINFRSHSLKKKTEYIIGESLTQSTIVYSGIDENEIISMKSSKIKHLEQKKVKIITACTLIKLKNIDKVLRELSKWENPNWEYTIIGDGPELSNLRRLVTKLKIESKVHFEGRLSRENTLRIMKDNHYFIMISKPETFGLVYLEAMAKGCIIFCAKDNGIDGIIENENNGFSINNENELNFYLEKLTENQNYRNTILHNSMKTIQLLTEDRAKRNYLNNILKQKGE